MIAGVWYQYKTPQSSSTLSRTKSRMLRLQWRGGGETVMELAAEVK
jgi:hypothetical protein